MRISDWSSDVCSSDLRARHQPVPDDRGSAVGGRIGGAAMIAQIERVSRHMNTPDTSAKDNGRRPVVVAVASGKGGVGKTHVSVNVAVSRSEERPAELQSVMSITYAVICLNQNHIIPSDSCS